MSEALLIMPNMRGGCATVEGKVHTLFRVNGRRPGLARLEPDMREAAPDDAGQYPRSADQPTADAGR